MIKKELFFYILNIIAAPLFTVSQTLYRDPPSEKLKVLLMAS